MTTKILIKEHLEVLKICEVCSAVKYDGKWLKGKKDFLKDKDPNEKVNIQFQKCPICRQEEFFNQYKIQVKN